MNLGIICPSDIAIRRFMPALVQCKSFSFAGIGVFNKEERFGSQKIGQADFEQILSLEVEKAKVFTDQHGGKIYKSYEDIVTSPEIDALYIPLPPALHYKWAKMALEHGKHVLVEKPATTSALDSGALVRIAKENSLAFHENYMFTFHDQLISLENIIRSGVIGDVRLYRISFGFPLRATNDFRYVKALGGGALIDAGGYTIRYAASLLGNTARLLCAQSNYIDQFEVDMYGSATLANVDGVTAQIAFGMDNNYKCDLEVWGSKGYLSSGRVLTAPAGYSPTAIIRNGNEERKVTLPSDDAFLKSILHFNECISNETVRQEQFKLILKQAELVDEFKRLAGWR